MKLGDPPHGASVEHHQLEAVEEQLQRSRTRVLVGRWTAAWEEVVAATAQHSYAFSCWATCGPNCSWPCAARGWWCWAAVGLPNVQSSAVCVRLPALTCLRLGLLMHGWAGGAHAAE